MKKENTGNKPRYSSDTLTTIAERHGLNLSTVMKRMERGKSLREALEPVGVAARQPDIRTERETRSLIEFLLNFRRENLTSPSLAETASGLALTIGKVRNVIAHLREKGKIYLTPQHKLAVTGERWLSPEEAKVLDEMLVLAKASQDMALRTLAQKLSAGLTDDPEGDGIYAPWLCPVQTTSLIRLRSLLSQDPQGQAYVDAVQQAQEKAPELDVLLNYLRNDENPRIKNMVMFLGKMEE